MKNRLSRLVPPILIFAIFFFGMALVQFSTPDLADNDGFYHIKMAWLMRTEGLKPAFPWLPLTILNLREFYDHHFLFHVAMIPFTFGDLVSGAKWAAVTFASLAFLAVWYLLFSQKIKYAWLWSMGLLAVSEAFLYRMSIPRAQSLSLGVLALAMAWMLQGNYRRLGILSFFYVWLYDAFPLLLALSFLYVIAGLITEKHLDFRPLIYVGAGLLLGLLVNPYFPFDIIFAYRHMLPKLVGATSIRVGSEWYPYTTEQLLGNALPALVVFTGGVFALGLAGQKMDLRTAFGLLASLLFGLMLFQARRFIEYFPAFALIFAAFAFQPVFQASQSEVETQPGPPDDCSGKIDSGRMGIASSSRLISGLFDGKRQRLVYTTVSLLVVLVFAARSITDARASMLSSKPFNLYAGASVWLQKNTPSEARVFQTDWDDFPRLFFYNTHNTYLIGLDPTYMQIADPDLYNLWVRITQGKIINLSQIILERFGATYIHTDLDHTEFIQIAERDPGLKEVYRDNQALIFQVITK